MLLFIIVVLSPLSYNMIRFKTSVYRNFLVTLTKVTLVHFLFLLFFWAEDEHVLCLSMVSRGLKYSVFLTSFLNSGSSSMGFFKINLDEY